MTLIVTHANGFLGCFTREADGSMRQRALIDTGNEPPTPETLANLGDSLDMQWHWTAPALPPAKPKALPPADRKTAADGRTKRKYPKKTYAKHPDDPLPAERPALILAYLTGNPYRTLNEVLEGIGLEASNGRVGRWSHVMSHMVKARMVDRRARNNGRQWEYWAL